jgi:hypothetical protein
MNKRVAGMWAAGFFALGSGLTLRDLRRGSTQLWLGAGGGYVADRATQPVRFWIYVSLNLAVLLLLLLGAIFAFIL